MRGKFITLEGIEGSGKSTQIALLRERLQSVGHRVLTTREPGGTPVAERLRDIVLNAGGDRISATSELLIMFAARAIHLDTLIRPALERGEWVLCDRFTDATFAYQGAGRGVPEEAIHALQGLVHGGLQPDLTLLFDLPVELGLARARARRGAQAADRFEREGREFFERVRAGFLDIARREPARVRVIDASRSPDEVAATVVAALAQAGMLQ